MQERVFTASEMMRFPPAIFTACVLGELRNSGIPVVGINTLEGVERGTLTEYYDAATMSLVYQWVDDATRSL